MKNLRELKVHLGLGEIVHVPEQCQVQTWRPPHTTGLNQIIPDVSQGMISTPGRDSEPPEYHL